MDHLEIRQPNLALSWGWALQESTLLVSTFTTAQVELSLSYRMTKGLSNIRSLMSSTQDIKECWAGYLVSNKIIVEIAQANLFIQWLISTGRVNLQHPGPVNREVPGSCSSFPEVQVLFFRLLVSILYHNTRHSYTSRTFIVPVLLYALLYNIPKFFELRTTCAESNTTSLYSPEFDNVSNCEYSDMEIQGTDMRSVGETGGFRLSERFSSPGRTSGTSTSTLFGWTQFSTSGHQSSSS